MLTVNAVERFLMASRRGDVEAATAELAPDVVMLNPATDEPIRGREAVARALRAVEEACDEFRHTHMLAEPTPTISALFALVFEATIGEAVLGGVDLIELDEDDRIATFTVAARPIAALMALGGRIAELDNQ